MKKKKENQENEKHIEEINVQPDETEDKLDELSKNYDFSIIDDDLLEKHACIKLP